MAVTAALILPGSASASSGRAAALLGCEATAPLLDWSALGEGSTLGDLAESDLGEGLRITVDAEGPVAEQAWTLDEGDLALPELGGGQSYELTVKLPEATRLAFDLEGLNTPGMSVGIVGKGGSGEVAPTVDERPAALESTPEDTGIRLSAAEDGSRSKASVLFDEPVSEVTFKAAGADTAREDATWRLGAPLGCVEPAVEETDDESDVTHDERPRAEMEPSEAQERRVVPEAACTGVTYYTSGTTSASVLYTLDLGTGTPTKVANVTLSGANISVNALAYNPVTDLLYGFKATSPYTMYTIDPGTAAATAVTVAPNSSSTALVLTGYDQGAISADGKYYYARKTTGALQVIDVSASGSEAFVGAGVTTGQQTFTDFAVNPVDGKLYATNSSSVVYRIESDPTLATLGANTALTAGSATSGYGAAVFDELGNLYVRGDAGTLGQYPLTTLDGGVATLGTSRNVVTGAGAQTYTDAASCPLPAYDRGDAPSSYGAAPSRYIDGLTVGSAWDAEPAAWGTDGTGDRSDDAFSSIPEVDAAVTEHSLDVPVINSTGSGATLAGWIDADGDGTFADAEVATVDVPDGTDDTLSLDWSSLSVTTTKATSLRLRLVSGTDPPTATGSIDSGETEDWGLTVNTDSAACPAAAYITDTTGKLYQLYGDSNTSQIGTASVGMTQFGYNTKDGMLYGWSTTQPTTTAAQRTLTVVDPSTGSAATGSPMSLRNSTSGATMPRITPTGAAISPDGTLLYLQVANTPSIYVINVAPNSPDYLRYVSTITMAATTGSTVSTFYDLAVHPRDGMLYGYYSNKVYRIDPSTGAQTALGTITGAAGTYNGSQFDTRGMLYLTGSSTMLRVDLSTLSSGLATLNTTGVVLAKQSGAIGSATVGDGGGCLPAADFSDAPATYNVDDPPWHLDPGDGELLLGALKDTDMGAMPLIPGTGDDTIDLADEDGVATWPTDANGTSYTVDVSVTNNSSAAATLAAWLDLNADGVFDTDERQIVSISAGSGTATVSPSWTLRPGEVRSGTTYARVRLIPGTVTDPSPTGSADAGEVEDYKIGLVNQGTCPAAVYMNTGSTLYSYLPPGGPVEFIGKATTTSSYDGMGYNTIDGQLYAMGLVGSTYQVAIINPLNGEAVMKPVLNNPETGANIPSAYAFQAGVLSPDGKSMYIISHGSNIVAGPIYVINTDPNDEDYLTLKKSIKAIAHVHDIAWHPKDNYIYMATGGTLYRVNPETGDQSTLATGITSTSLGEGMTFDSKGNLYINDANKVYSWDLTQLDPGTGLAVLASKTATIYSSTGTYTDLAYCLPPPLEVTKTASSETAAPGQDITYSWTIENPSGTAKTGVSIDDDLSAVLDDAVIDEDSLTASDGDISYDPATQTLTWTKAVVPAKSSYTVSYTVKTNADGGGDGSMVNKLVSSEGNCALGSPDSRCTTTVTVGSMTMSKTASADTVEIGGDITYTVTVTNTSSTVDLTDIAFDDDLSAVLDDADMSGTPTATSGDVTYSDALQRIAWVGDLAAGASATITYTVTTKSGGDLSMVNDVVATAGPCATNSTDSSTCTTTVIVTKPEADLSMDKQVVDADPVVPGTTFEFRITVTNNGPSDAVNVLATDELPTALSFVSGTDCSASGQSVTCGPEATLANGASVSWTFTVLLDSSYTGDGSDIGNIAVADADTDDPDDSNNSNTPAATPGVADPQADLSMDKQVVDTDPVVPGTTFEYQITITNNGPSDAVNVLATDELPTALSFVSGTDCSASGQSVTCGPEATLANGDSVSWTFTVLLDSSYTGDGSDIGNIAVADADTEDPNPSNDANETPGATPGVTSPQADLSMDKAALNTDPVVPGTTFEYRIMVTNNGPSDAVNVLATDELPTALSFVSGTDCSASGQSVTCGPEATLANGASVSWTFTVLLDSSYTGDGSDIGNIAVADADTEDPNPSNDTNTPAVTPSGGVAGPQADLSMDKQVVDTDPVVAGDTFEYRITITNNGPSDAVNVLATDELPTALSFVSGTDCSASGQSVTCGPQATLTNGASATWTFTVLLDSSYTGDGSDIGNIAVADTDTEDPNPSNDANTPAATPGIADPQADLSMEKQALNTDPVVPGTTFEYRITITNNGPSDAVNVLATDELPTALSFVSSDAANSSVCAASGQSVTCGPEADLVNGDSVSWTFMVLLDASYTGDGSDIGNIAVADADTEDPNPSNDANETPGATPGVTSPEADLSMDKAALNTDPVVPGTTFEYRITITNNGPSDAVNVLATDELPTALSFVSSDAANSSVCAASGQSVTCGPEATLANGDSVNWVFTVLLDSSYTGDGSDIGNIAVADADTDDPNPSNDANTPAVTPSGGVAGPQADLSMDKQVVDTDPVVAGDTFEYRITITNNGPSDAVNVLATDELPTALSFVSGTDCSASGQSVTCGPEATLANGDSVSWTFTVLLDASYTGDGSDIGNIAVADADTEDPNPSNDANETPGATPGVTSPEADLSMDKQVVDADPVVPGTTFEFRITVTNNGPSDAVNVLATDELPTALSFVSSDAANSSVCTASGQSVTCGPEATLANGDSVSWTFMVLLDSSYTGDGSDIGNIAVADADTDDPNPSNDANETPGATPGVTDPQADLSMDKAALNTDPVVAGDTFEYRITVTNNGPSDAVNVLATDELPTALSFVSGTDCSASGQSVTCGPEATLANGDSANWVFTVLLDSSYTGDGSDIGNIAVADADTDDPDDSNNSNTPAATPGVADPRADLSMDKQIVGTDPVVAGDTFEYRITVTNNGPSDAVNVLATDELPTALSFVSGTDCSASGQSVTCGPEATLANGDSVSWTFTVLLDSSYTGDGSDIGNIAVADADTDDPNPSNDTNETPGVTPPGVLVETDLAITKTFDPATPGPVSPGEEFNYLITIDNLGLSDAAEQLVVADNLPDGLTLVSAVNDQGDPVACEIISGEAVCDATPVLQPNSSMTVTVTVRLDPAYTGDGSELVNTATVKADNNDPDESNNTSSITGLPGGVGEPKIDLEVRLSPQKTTVAPGESIWVDTWVENHGPSTNRVDTDMTLTLPKSTSLGSDLPAGCTASSATILVCIVPPGLPVVPYTEAMPVQQTEAMAEAMTEAATARWRVPIVISANATPNSTLTGGIDEVHYPNDWEPANDELTWQLNVSADTADPDDSNNTDSAAVSTTMMPVTGLVLWPLLALSLALIIGGALLLTRRARQERNAR